LRHASTARAIVAAVPRPPWWLTTLAVALAARVAWVCGVDEPVTGSSSLAYATSALWIAEQPQPISFVLRNEAWRMWGSGPTGGAGGFPARALRPRARRLRRLRAGGRDVAGSATTRPARGFHARLRGGGGASLDRAQRDAHPRAGADRERVHLQPLERQRFRR